PPTPVAVPSAIPPGPQHHCQSPGPPQATAPSAVPPGPLHHRQASHQLPCPPQHCHSPWLPPTPRSTTGRPAVPPLAPPTAATFTRNHHPHPATTGPLQGYVRSSELGGTGPVNSGKPERAAAQPSHPPPQQTATDEQHARSTVSELPLSNQPPPPRDPLPTNPVPQ
ncbi:hypothetical protein FKM82_014239, partial [Ascaphus truei]